MSRPNVLFLFTDDQRFDTLGALDHPDVQTPNLDRLLAGGTCFTHAHIPGGTSGAVCMPSRAMLHTGRTLFHLDGAGQVIPAGHALLGETLGAAGYRTFGTGKWHNGHAAFNRSFQDGDEILFGGMGDHWNVPAFHYDPSGEYATRLPICPNPWGSNEVQFRACDHIPAGQHSTELFVDAACEFLTETPADQPFFCYVSFMAPHDPRTMPPQFLEMYDPETITLPPNFCGGHPFDNGALHIRDEELAPFPRTPPVVRQHLAEYYAMISHVDHEVGRVLDLLEERGLRDNTIIVFAGDNGLALGQHGLFGKQNLYEHSTRVPLIFNGPGIAAGVRSEELVYLLDIFPTLCDLTGVSVPETVEGRDLAPIWRAGAKGREQLYLVYTEFQRGLRTRTHKLIEYAVGGRRTTQLFDLASDPWETNDLAADPAHSERVAELRTLLLAERDAWDDPASPWGETFWAAWRD